MIVIYFMIIHLCIVLLIFILMSKNIIRVDSIMLTLVLCIPVWGVLAAVFISIIEYRGKSGQKKKDLEALSGAGISKESIPTPIGESENIVPLEDALIMDDPSIRRSVMMDVLMQDASSYIPVLNQARMNDDAEVVHYATTAMASLSKEYELKLQDLSSQYAENPMKEGLLDEYIDFLDSYISSGMISGQFLEIQQRTYQQLLTEKANVAQKIEDYAALARSFLETKDYSQADVVLSAMEKNWPENDTCFLLRFRYYYETGSGSNINRMIKMVTEGEGFYSRKVRNVVDFWIKKGRRDAV